MRILLLTQWFDPEPIFKGLAFARPLVERGHQVQVLTGFPNYPGGTLYPGYPLSWRRRETIDGVEVIRVPLYPSHDGSSTRRACNYASFGLAAATLGVASIRTPDVAYVYHPPGSVGLPAVVLKTMRRCPFVYDIQDLWPDSVASSGMLRSPRLIAALGWWCRYVYRRATRIVVLSPGIARLLRERGVPGEKIDVIYNWCDESSLQAVCGTDADRCELGMDGRFNVVFAGTMGKVQALDTVLDAAALLGPRLPFVQFLLVGGGVEVARLKESAGRRNLRNVRFLPRQPFNRIGRILSLADVLLVHLKNDPLFEVTIPSKTQAYMAMGKPIIMAVRGDAADMVGRAECGVTCDPEQPEELASCVERLAEMDIAHRERMGANGKQYYNKHLSLSVGVARFEDVFRRAAGEAVP